MSSLAVSSITFACVFGGALLGITLRAVLPEHHLSSESRDVVKLGMGLVGTMAALLLGLLIASAKASYDTQSIELTDMSAKVVLLDRVLAHYGPESKDARELLRNFVSEFINRTWSKSGTSDSQLAAPSGRNEIIYEEIQGLSPKNDAQRALQGQALSILMGLGQTRWLMYEQKVTALNSALLVGLVLWLSFLFVSFGMFAP